MISKEYLDFITKDIRETIVENPDIQLSNEDKTIWYMEEVIISLHNLLYEAVTGERYDYMFHWYNKSWGGLGPNDDLYDRKLLKGEKKP